MITKLHLKLAAIIYIVAFSLSQLYAQTNKENSIIPVPALDRDKDVIESSYHNWPSIDAEWYYEVRPMVNCVPCVISYQSFGIVGDTLIQSKNCAILQRFNSLALCESLGSDYEFIYQSNDTVFWYNATIEEFTILYDFSAMVGDSWEILVHNCSFTVSVDLVDSLFIANRYYKVFHVSDDNNYFTGNIIENIGHTTAFFPKEIYWECQGLGCDSDIIDGLRCYIQSDTLIYKWSDEPCDTTYLITGIQHIEENEFSLFPNPANDFIYLNLPDNLLTDAVPLYYRIINSKGHLVTTADISGVKRVNIGALDSGIYIFQLYDKKSNLNISNHKILKL